ncbi:MAG: SurA N-terminal domain-containing protein [Pseudomonadota bacterium]
MMLHSIRERAKGWFAWVIVILISIPFALWGIGSYITPDANPAIATVDDIKISSYEFQNALQREQQQIQSQSRKMDEGFLKQAVLDRLINNKALLSHLISEGYTTSRATVNQQILSDNNFQDPNTGQFSEQIFKQLLQRMGLSFESYKKLLANDLLTQQYTNGISQTAWINQQEVDSVVALLKQKRDISYITISTKMFAESIHPSDEEVSSFYEENKQKYEVSEKVKVDYIELSRKEIAKTIDISEDDIEASYNNSIAKFTIPEQRQASHILISFNKDDDDEKKAKAKELIDSLHKKLQDGEDFATLAKEYSKDPGSAQNGGDLGYFNKGDMVPEFEEVSYSLKIDAISEPFESPFGFHIIKLTAIRAAQVKPLDEVRQQIISDLQYDHAEKEYFEKSELLQTIAYEQPDSLEPAASEVGAQILISPLLAKSGGEELFSNKKLISAIFDEQILETGNNSDLIEVGNDHVVVVRINEKIPEFIKPLEQVKQEIVKTLIIKEANDKALDLANSLSKLLAEQQDIKQQLSDNKLEIVDEGLIDRNNLQIAPQILQKAFTLPRVKDKPESIAFMMRDNSGEDNKAVVLLLKAVENGISDDKEFRAMVANGLKQSRGSLYANMAIKQARSNARVEINKERLVNQDDL